MRISMVLLRATDARFADGANINIATMLKNAIIASRMGEAFENGNAMIAPQYRTEQQLK